MIEGIGGQYHADPLFAKHGKLKIGDLYKHKVRTLAWKFWNGCLPENQAEMFRKVYEVHGYSTRSAESGISRGAADHKSLRYIVPKEWSTLPEELRALKSLAAYKKQSKKLFLRQYEEFWCGGGCGVCSSEIESSQGGHAES